MSDITDSTTTIGTTWTEQTLPAFTAGTLSTLDTCIDEVEAKLQRGTLSTSTTPTLAQAQNWLRRKKQEIAEAFGFSFTRKYASVSLVADQYRYSLPPDFAGGRVVLRETTNNREIPVWSSGWFDKKFPDPSEESSNEIKVACIKNMELWLAPPPDSSDTLEIEYPRSGAETTASDFSWLPELMRYRCCDGAIAEAFESLHMWGEADRYHMKYQQGLLKAKRADNRKRWQGKRMSGINVFQEYNARNYQPNANR
jgi:hypothetical protein